MFYQVILRAVTVAVLFLLRLITNSDHQSDVATTASVLARQISHSLLEVVERLVPQPS